MQNVKGTHDIIGKEANNYSYAEEVMKSIASLFGYQEVRVPEMEYTEVFQRGVGDGSDIVRKEMYTFLDKGGRSITLRPEFTAGIVRMVVQNKLLATSELPLKVFYTGPAFRYERPQQGRYRQFHQFGVEAFGDIRPLNVVETISFAYSILTSLGLENVTIRINTLGDDASRNNYREALRNYFAPRLDEMCPDCHERFKLNPLRILDCKVPEDQEIVKGAPKMSDFLTEESKANFKEVLDLLTSLEIPFEKDDTLVRGLDYYSGVVFEFHYVSKKNEDYGALGGGGAYNKLVKELGGPDIAGIGFSFGIERLVSVLSDDDLIKEQEGFDFYVAPLGENAKKYGLVIANELRLSGYKTDLCFEDVKIGNMIKRAIRKEAKYLLLIGDEEIARNEVVIKDLKTQEQRTIKIEELIPEIDKLFLGE